MFPTNLWINCQQYIDGSLLDTEYVNKVSLNIATQCIGLEPNNPVYYEALYPWDEEVYQKNMAIGQYKCALTILMFYRAMGYELPTDGMQYRWRFMKKPPQTPPPDAVTQFRQLPGFVTANALGKIGDSLLIGRSNDPNSVHALMIKSIQDGKLTSIDGGWGAIKEKTRNIVTIGNQICLQDEMGNRPIIGYCKSDMRKYLKIIRPYYEPSKLKPVKMTHTK